MHAPMIMRYIVDFLPRLNRIAARWPGSAHTGLRQSGREDGGASKWRVIARR